MEAEWDEGKARANLRKHGVEFRHAAMVLLDEVAITVLDERAGERRCVTIGADLLGRLLTVVYTWRGDRVRLISARRATGNERRRYRKE